MTDKSHQNPKRSSETHGDDLPWLAFCYVADELAASARRKFEIRLEHDQTARDAVAQAFDNAWLLDRALSQAAGRVPASACELTKSNLRRSAHSGPGRSKLAWPKVLLGIGIAGLLALILLQIDWKPAKVEVAQQSQAPVLNERTTASVSLAETWADSEWDAEFEPEIDEFDFSLAQVDSSDSNQELIADDEQDDWMTTTLIDMAEELEPSPLQAGS